MKEDRSETSIFDVIKDKVFFSCFSNEMAIVVDEIPAEREGGKVYFDGMTLIDDVEDVQDDIQQVYSYTEYGKKVNLEDYYQENGVFNEDRSRLIETLDELMNHEEYEHYLTRQNAPFEDRVRLY